MTGEPRQTTAYRQPDLESFFVASSGMIVVRV